MSDANGIALDLPFKGERDYLHGTSLFDALLAATGAQQGLSLRIQQMMRSAVEAVPLSAVEASERRALAAQFRFDGGALGIRETGAAVKERIPYDEDAICAGASPNGERIEVADSAGYSWIERVVAHQKRLLNVHFGETPWVFARLELPSLPQPGARTALALRPDAARRMARSEILVDDAPHGAIDFVPRP